VSNKSEFTNKITFSRNSVKSCENCGCKPSKKTFIHKIDFYEKDVTLCNSCLLNLRDGVNGAVDKGLATIAKYKKTGRHL